MSCYITSHIQSKRWSTEFPIISEPNETIHDHKWATMVRMARFYSQGTSALPRFCWIYMRWYSGTRVLRLKHVLQFLFYLFAQVIVRILMNLVRDRNSELRIVLKISAQRKLDIKLLVYFPRILYKNAFIKLFVSVLWLMFFLISYKIVRSSIDIRWYKSAGPNLVWSWFW